MFRNTVYKYILNLLSGRFLLTIITVFIINGQCLAGPGENISGLKHSSSFASDTLHVNELIDLSWNTQEASPGLALSYCIEGIKLAYVINYKKGIASGLNCMGVLFYNSAKYEVALKLFEASIHIQKSIGSLRGVASSLNNIGNIYVNYGDYDKALDYLKNSVKLKARFGDMNGTANSLNNIGNIYSYLGNYPLSISYYQKALSIHESINDSIGIATTLGNLANIYSDQGNLELALLYYKKALDIFLQAEQQIKVANMLLNISKIYHKKEQYALAYNYSSKALKISENLKYDGFTAYCLHSLGDIATDLKQYSKAVKYLKGALALMQKTGNKEGETLVLNTLARLHLNEHNYNEAVQYCLQSIKIGEKIGVMRNVQFAAEILSAAYAGKEDYKNALKFHKYYKNIYDSIYNLNVSKRIQEISMLYRSEQQKKEIELLNEKAKTQDLVISESQTKRRLQSTIFAVLMVFIIGSVVVVYQRNKHRQKVNLANAMAEQEKIRFREVVEAQEKERKRIAGDLHDGVGMLLATAKLNLSVLEEAAGSENSNDNDLITKAKNLVDQSYTEIRGISHNLMPGVLIELGLIPAIKDLCSKIQIQGCLEVAFNAGETVDKLSETFGIAVYRIVQEVLANTLKHANACKIDVSLQVKENIMNIRISDNGIGFNPREIEKSKGIGWKSIFSRVAMLNGNIKINSAIEQGTVVEINIPVILS